MGKRFTDSEKWRDRWFRKLAPEFKLAWLYLLDACDHAGVIELDEELANFMIGTSIDWAEFVTATDGRVIEIGRGRLLVCRFIEFQYGEISRNCKAHNPVFASIKKYGIGETLERVSKGYPKGIQRDQDKDKDKDKDKDQRKENERDSGSTVEDCASADGDCAPDDWEVPPDFDSIEVRTLLDEFVEMRQRLKKPVRSKSRTSRVFRQFDDRDHLVYALETCIANDYQGLKPDYRPPRGSGRGGGSSGAPTTFAQQRVANSANAAKEFIEDDRIR